jgi:acyl-CoA reductase-like NAD-dependent aldehyde dehydrogenase
MAKMISPSVEWHGLLAQAKALVPEAFSSDGRVLNLMEGEWGHPGHGKTYMSAVDGTFMGNLPMLNLDEAKRAVRYCAQEFKTWYKVPIDQRKQRVVDALALLKQHRELIGRLLIWEIGKPYITAMTDVDRCISGVEWYVDQIDSQMAGHTPLGVISNIASWNYPLSVLVHAMLVQVLAGNSVIAKTPTDGGLYALTVSLALARRCGLPVSLVSGSGRSIE